MTKHNYLQDKEGNYWYNQGGKWLVFKNNAWTPANPPPEVLPQTTIKKPFPLKILVILLILLAIGSYFIIDSTSFCGCFPKNTDGHTLMTCGKVIIEDIHVDTPSTITALEENGIEVIDNTVKGVRSAWHHAVYEIDGFNNMDVFITDFSEENDMYKEVTELINEIEKELIESERESEYLFDLDEYTVHLKKDDPLEPLLYVTTSEGLPILQIRKIDEEFENPRKLLNSFEECILQSQK